MQVMTTVTQKGQITLPKFLRDSVNVRVRNKVVVKKAKDHLKVYPIKDILDLAGTYKPKKNKSKSALKARESMEKQYKRV